ncbi:hypothetical protein GH714_042391 [Hevea brasiliensis]|uniref:Transposase MuDR plant domain-containing protein n=1 Tax=Hevea brasiliensis TaxID=3981 RepID=A0A6A6LMF6_HEVBR|nr:hypothetical protein GH714_042391 [Hevea brasiliensis]
MATPSTSKPIKILRPGGSRFFTIILHVKGLREWGYYDEVTWTVPFCQDVEMSLVRIDKLCQGLKLHGLLREANVDYNIEIVNDVQCEASISEHGVNEENSDGSVRAKEVNVDDGFNEYIDALIGSERLDDYINPIMEDNMGNFGNNSQDVPCEEVNICQSGGDHAMNARGVNVQEGNPNRSGVNAQADDELHDNEYEMEEGDEDVQDVLHGINIEINNDSNNQKENQKGGPKATEERMRNEGFGASLSFDTVDTDSKYGDSDELHSNSDSEGDGEKVRFPEFNMDRDIGDPTFKVGMIFSTRDEFKNVCKAYGIKHRFELLFFQKNDFQWVQARCKKECGWKIWASKLHPKDLIDQTMQIKTASLNHSCGKSFTNYHVTAKWIASHYLETYKNDPDLNFTGLIGRIKITAYVLAWPKLGEQKIMH